MVFNASGGAQIHVNGLAAASYSSTGLRAGTFAGTINFNLFTAAGAGTLLDLSAIQSLNAGYGGVTGTNNQQNITASGGGDDQSLGRQDDHGSQPPLNDWLQFNVTDNSQINLSNLATVTTAGSGQVNFVANNGATLQLPSLTSLTDVVFNASGGAQIHVNGLAAASYSSTGLRAGTFAGTINFNLFTAAGSSTLLDLSAIQSLNAGYGGVTGTNNQQNITASGGATINLSGVKTITAPSALNDWLQFNVTDNSQINLSNLATVTTAGSGQVNFVANNGATLQLPSLTSLTDVVFNASGGAQIHVNGLAAASYSSTGLRAGTFSGTINFNLFTAAGAGTLLDLSAIQSLNAGYGGVTGTNNQQNITASGGRRSISRASRRSRLPTPSTTGCQFNVTDNSQINLSNLATVTTAGSGQVNFVANNGAVPCNCPASPP